VGESHCWKIGFQALAREVPLNQASSLFGEFHGFGCALVNAAGEPLGWRPATCRCLCRDESLILALLERQQHGETLQVLMTAQALVGVEELGDVLEATQSLGAALYACGLFLKGLGSETSVYAPTPQKRPSH
jgi:hypothetical protein